jgi:hypothetical protein
LLRTGFAWGVGDDSPALGQFRTAEMSEQPPRADWLGMKRMLTFEKVSIWLLRFIQRMALVAYKCAAICMKKPHETTKKSSMP